jgi:hypothetical protein
MRAAMRFVAGAIVLAALVAVSGVSARSTAPPVIAVNCTLQAATLFLEPSGQMRVVEYKSDPDKHIPPTSTGRVILAADATSRTINPSAPCHRIKAVKKPERGFAGPWGRDVETRVTCVAPTKEYGIDFQLRNVLNKAKRTIGNRIVVLQKTILHATIGVKPKLVTVAEADAWVTRTGGGIKFDPTMCPRNLYP